MTSAELWRQVGKELLDARSQRNWNWSDVEAHGGPNYQTVKAIERGKIGRIDKLELHVQALGLSLPDLLRVILARDGAKALSPEQAQIVSVFERTSVKGRQALLALAQALPVDVPDGEPPLPPPPPPDLPE